MASGAGFEAPEGLPRLGWDAISGLYGDASRQRAVVGHAVARVVHGVDDQIGIRECLDRFIGGHGDHAIGADRTVGIEGVDHAISIGGGAERRAGEDGCKVSHFESLAPVPEARRIRRIHDSNIRDYRALRKDYFVGENPMLELKANQ